MKNIIIGFIYFVAFLTTGCRTFDDRSKTSAPLQLNAAKEVDFLSFPGCGDVSEDEYRRLVDVDASTIRKLIEGDVDTLLSLPDHRLKGTLKFKRYFETVTDYDDHGVPIGQRKIDSKLPMLDDRILYPLIGTNGYPSFEPLSVPKPEKILNIKFTDFAEDVSIEVTGKRSFIASPIGDWDRCRFYGPALLVTSAVVDGVSYELTSDFPPPIPKATKSDDPSSLFVSMGTADRRRWFDPIKFYMDRSVAVLIIDDLLKRQLLTSWLYPIRNSNGTVYREIGYRAGISRNNELDPNWSFGMSIFEFLPPLTRLQEICDGNFGQIESAYRSYSNYKVSPLDSFCPWGGSNEIVDIRNNLGQILSDDQIKDLLETLGGEVSEFKR